MPLALGDHDLTKGISRSAVTNRSQNGHSSKNNLCLDRVPGARGWGAAPAKADDKPPLKVGVLEDHSGDIAIFTMPKVHGAHLAVDEINAAGGILGRKVEITEYHPQFDNAKFQEFARRLIEKDKVEVIFGAATSARAKRSGRSSTRTTPCCSTPSSTRAGSATANDRTGGVPEQQFSTLIPYMMEKFGKKVYIIAADYNFGQISTEWTKKLVTEAGGQIVGAN